jgi:hypothetical protein
MNEFLDLANEGIDATPAHESNSRQNPEEEQPDREPRDTFAANVLAGRIAMVTGGGTALDSE